MNCSRRIRSGCVAFQGENFLHFEELLEFIFELHPQGAFEFIVVEHEVCGSEDVFGMGPEGKGFEAKVAVEGSAGLTAAVMVDGPDPGFLRKFKFGFEGALLPVLDRGNQGPHQEFAELLIHFHGCSGKVTPSGNGWATTFSDRRWRGRLSELQESSRL